jgi:hypothetical protein
MERSEIRVGEFPHSAALHAGYLLHIAGKIIARALIRAAHWP